MAIIAEKSGNNYFLIDAGSYAARCYSMVHIGTIEEEFQGETKKRNKVRLTWEIPSELHVFNAEKGEQPVVISKEYTLSMHEKSTLRKDLEAWRGKAFTDEEAKKFDITKLIGVQCMLSIIHKETKSGVFANISGINTLPKGMSCEPLKNEKFELSYDQPKDVWLKKFETLPDFIKEKIKISEEYKKMNTSEIEAIQDFPETEEQANDIPF